jgi:acyl-homoserine-lactone acylase
LPTGPVLVEGTPIDIGAACAALDGWDGRFDLESRGAALWREFAVGHVRGNDAAWAVPADPDDPVNTPRTLAPPPVAGPDPVVESLARAVDSLGRAGLAPDAPLGEAQYTLKGDDRIPVHGGLGVDGVLNVVSTGGTTAGATLAPQPKGGEPIAGRTDQSGLTTDGYLVLNGTSFLLAVELDEDGPEASALLTYSQSSDPSSANFDDQTRLFSQKQWREVRFSDGEIAADPNLETFTVHGN